MDKIYEKYKDLNVSATIVYYDPYDDPIIPYKDYDHSEEFTPAEFADVCLNGALFYSGSEGDYLGVPIDVSISETATVATVAYTTGYDVTYKQIVAGTLEETDGGET